MQSMSLTRLRSNLYKVVDEIIETGIPVEIERNGRKLKIVLEEKKSKLANLTPHDCIVGDPEDLVSLSVCEMDARFIRQTA
jgi:hypothetical protein